MKPIGGDIQIDQSLINSDFQNNTFHKLFNNEKILRSFTFAFQF